MFYRAICGLVDFNQERSRKASTNRSAAWKNAKLKLASVQAQIAGRPKLAKSRIKHPSTIQDGITVMPHCNQNLR
jgi:hypothetical protein